MGRAGLFNRFICRIKMTEQEDDDLFSARVHKVNRDCLSTFLPYIKIVVSILLTIGAAFLGATIYLYQDLRADVKQMSSMAIENKANLTEIKAIQMQNTDDIRSLFRGTK